VNLHWPVLLVAAALLVAAGAGATYFVLRPATDPDGGRAEMAATTRSGDGSPISAPTPPSAATLPDVVVPLSPDAVARAGIAVATVDTGSATSSLRLPGVVEPNAYRQVVVTPAVGGRITRVLVELGERVRRGQTMAQVFSPELAEAHTRYTSARAELEVHERELGRTEKLVEIGAASRQELERIHAEHTARTADVGSTRSRLELLGVPAATLDAAPGNDVRAGADVPAPIEGVVTERLANIGLNVDPASKLFTIVDLTTVWVVADLYEKDFSRVRVGSPATVTTTAYPDLVIQGRVNYIDPQLSAETRTAKLRVEVRNVGNQLRLGMYADVQVAGIGGAAVPTIPRSAVQTVGDRRVVYLVDPSKPGTFTEREVRLGPAIGDRIEALSGVQAGDAVATEGSFFVRAELERLGLRARPASAHVNVQTAKVVVGEQGYEPTKVSLRAGAPAQITFVRTTDKTCGAEVVFPSLNIRRALPLNEPVVIELTPAKPGEVAFACGMNMLHGAVVVQE
jgi:RND family efflux transporter MFP subunit